MGRGSEKGSRAAALKRGGSAAIASSLHTKRWCTRHLSQPGWQRCWHASVALLVLHRCKLASKNVDKSQKLTSPFASQQDGHMAPARSI